MSPSSCSEAVHEPCTPMQLHDAIPSPTKPPRNVCPGTMHKAAKESGGSSLPNLRTPCRGADSKSTRHSPGACFARPGAIGSHASGIPSCLPRWGEVTRGGVTQGSAPLHRWAIAVRRVAARAGAGCRAGEASPKERPLTSDAGALRCFGNWGPETGDWSLKTKRHRGGIHGA
jgi:hypothetical protein